MSSNRLLAAGAALFMAGCAAQNPVNLADITTPTRQFTATAEAAPEEVLLAAHEGELSDAQYQAVWTLTVNWREAGDGVILIEAPSNGGPVALQTAAKVEAALRGFGVSAQQYATEPYDYRGDGKAPVRVSYLRYAAKALPCGKVSSDFTATFSNEPHSNFGCAVTANIAAMVANPADLVRPRVMDAPDAARRQDVLDKYRAGQITSSAKDDQADGTVSKAVN